MSKEDAHFNVTKFSGGKSGLDVEMSPLPPATRVHGERPQAERSCELKMQPNWRSWAIGETGERLVWRLCRPEWRL